MLQNYAGLEPYTEDIETDGIAISGDDTLLANIRPYLKKVWKSEFNGACSTDVLAFSPKQIHPDFLYSLIAQDKFIDYVMSGAKGSKMPRGDKSHIMDYTTSIPAEDEQHKISSFIELINKRVAVQTHYIEHLKKYKRGVVRKLFAQEIRFTSKDGRPFPNWEEYPLENVVDFLDGQRKPLESAERATMKGNYPYYGASGIIDYIDRHLFDEPLLLLGEDGANIITRSSPLCFIATGKYWVNNHAHVMRPKKGFDLQFVCEALESIDYTKYNTGTAQPKLNQEKCRKITFRYPCYDEQLIIADFLRDLNKRIEKSEKQLLLLDAQKKALLQQLFI